MRRLRCKLTYANVMATIAVFIALGGASYAATQLPKSSVGTKQIKNNAITTAKIKNGAVTGAKVKSSTLGTVPSATNATNAANARNAVDATHADSASVAGSIAPPEAFRNVGEPGQPLFAPSWKSIGLETAPVAFYKDREGLVHLQGTGQGNGSEELVFIVPTGYAPAANEYFPTLGSSGAFSVIRVSPLGEVVSTDKSRAHLDGITWRAAG